MTKNIAKLVAGTGLALALSGCATTSNNYSPEKTPQKPRIENAEKYGTAIQFGSFLYLLSLL